MHRILKETHRKENIDLLKARDVYFDKARRLNNTYRTVCLMAPIVLSLAGTFVIVFSHFYTDNDIINSAGEFLNNYLEIIVGITALIAFVFDCFIALRIDDCLAHSNRLRELYDCRVLRVGENRFLYSDLDTTVEEDLKAAAQRPDSDKYEVWYRETFSDNEFANAICAMMDNILYTYYIYMEYHKKLNTKLILYSVALVSYTAFYHLSPHDITARLISPFILFLAVFDRIKDLISSYLTSRDLEKTNKSLKDTVISHASEIMVDGDADGSSEGKKQFLLRNLQDIIARNRDDSLFVPKSIRNKYLLNGNPYYRDLDEVKNIFWKNTDIRKPCVPADYDIPTTENDSEFVSLETVHSELRNMLLDVKAVLDEAGIAFFLDGGTLIGSVREEGARFLAWDDDVDLSLMESDAEEAISVIRRELGDRYEVQDCTSEKYYSPRLSRFRVRQKNCKSIVCEKDSELYELYEARGLFLDVYTYSPILINRSFDSACRRLLFYPLYRQLKQTESAWKCASDVPDEKERYLQKFSEQKRCLMRRTKWYLKHAKCKEYYTYIPGYIEDIRKTGPYIKGVDIYGAKNTGMFEGNRFGIPSVPEKVLAAFYGENWHRSPYKSLESIKNGEWYSFSSDTFDASCYKHLKAVSIYDDK